MTGILAVNAMAAVKILTGALTTAIEPRGGVTVKYGGHETLPRPRTHHPRHRQLV